MIPWLGVVQIHVLSWTISVAQGEQQEQELLEVRSELERLKDAQAAGTCWEPFEKENHGGLGKPILDGGSDRKLKTKVPVFSVILRFGQKSC